MRAAARGFFPLDERWGLDGSDYSPERARQMVWLSGLVPYEQAAWVFEKIGHCDIPATSIWRQAQRHGERLKRYQQDQHYSPDVLSARAGGRGTGGPAPSPPQVDHQERQGVSLDGGKMHIRDEGWKEFKVGTVYDVALRPEPDPETGEWVERAHGVNMAYRAVLGSAEEFGRAFWALAVEKHVPQAASPQGSGSGT